MNEGTAGAPVTVQRVVIAERHAGQRIDNFLLGHLRKAPRALVYRILRTGQVRVNSGRIRQGYRLAEGDIVRIPPLKMPPQGQPRTPPERVRDDLNRRVLRESDGWLVLDKPSGVAVHGGSGLSFGVIEALRAARPAERMLELAHRLDRETSGCLLVARRRAVLRNLHAQLREGRIRKRYLALVYGRWAGPVQVVDAPLRRSIGGGGERLVRATPEGKAARTRFRILEECGRATLIEALPTTGRTHQIRVHALAAGHPLAGDAKYGNRTFNRALHGCGLRRLFLHASALSFYDPDGDAMITVSAPLPPELGAVLAALGLNADRARNDHRRKS